LKDFCLFLEDDPFMEGKMCSAGVNFANVGPDRAICRLCKLSNLGDVPLCPNVEVYTYYCNSTEGAFVEVDFYCQANDLQPQARCQSCPDHSGLSMSIPMKEDYFISIQV
jgi:hypothetical protein